MWVIVYMLVYVHVHASVCVCVVRGRLVYEDAWLNLGKGSRRIPSSVSLVAPGD